MSNLTSGIVIAMCINLVLFFANSAISGVTGQANSLYTPGQGDIICQYDSGNCEDGSYSITADSPSSFLPSVEATVSPTTGNIFTDTVSSLTRWIRDIPGVKHAMNFVFAPIQFMNALHLPDYIIFGLGAFWYVIMIDLLTSWIFGRGD